jgi:hypothetical protein
VVEQEQSNVRRKRGLSRSLKLFPLPQLARRVFGTLENGRIDRRLRTRIAAARDLDLIREHLSRSRPQILDLPALLVPFELLFQVTMLGGARDDARQYYGQIVSELETIVSDYLRTRTRRCRYADGDRAAFTTLSSQ